MISPPGVSVQTFRAPFSPDRIHTMQSGYF
jgi:hypothetical protein